MSFEVVNEELRIASCGLADLTLRQVSSFLEQWGKGASIGELTLYYDRSLDQLVINRDNKHYSQYLKIAEAYLSLDRESQKAAKKAMPETMDEAVKVLDGCVRYRHGKAEREISRYDELIGFSGTEEGDFFEEAERRYRGSMIMIMSCIYNYGVRQGKRMERARRRKATCKTING